MSHRNRDPAADERQATSLDPTRVVAQRHQVSIRTVERWTDAGILPPPLRINGRKFWPAGTRAKIDTAA
jgi:hypothetical protein